MPKRLNIGDLVTAEGGDEVFSVTQVLANWSGSRHQRATEVHYIVACKIKNGVVLKRVERFRGYNWVHVPKRRRS
jgi:hypothetical protein